MTASQKPKTPSMTMKVKAGISEADVALFCKRASRVTLSQVVDHVTVQEELRSEGNARRTQFTVDINFYPKAEYEEEYDLDESDVLMSFGVQFPLTLKKEIISEMKKLDADLKSQMAQLGHGKKVSAKAGEAEGDDDEAPKKRKDDDEGSEVGDGDADDEKHARQKKQQATYDSDDSEDEGEIGAFDDAALEAELASDGEASDMEVKKPKKKSFKAMVETVSSMCQKHMHHCIAFDFADGKATLKLEVRKKSRDSLVMCYLPFSSSLPICLSCSSWVSSNALVAPPSSVKSPVSRTVSK